MVTKFKLYESEMSVAEAFTEYSELILTGDEENLLDKVKNFFSEIKLSDKKIEIGIREDNYSKMVYIRKVVRKDKLKNTTSDSITFLIDNDTAYWWDVDNFGDFYGTCRLIHKYFQYRFDVNGNQIIRTGITKEFVDNLILNKDDFEIFVDSERFGL